MASNIEFFDELRGLVGEEAARVIVRRTTSTDLLATKDDIREVEVRLVTEMSRLQRWMLTFHTGQWVATAGLIVAIVLKG